MSRAIASAMLLGSVLSVQAQHNEQGPAPDRPPSRNETSPRDAASRGWNIATMLPLPRPGTTSPITLGGLAAVQTELKLTDAQKAAFAQLVRQLTEQQAQLAQETLNRAQALNRDAEDNARKLLTTEQLARLEQLRVQRAGPSALLWPEVSESLHLSEDQRARLTRLEQELSRSSPFGGFTRSPGLGVSTTSAGREKILADMLAVLTPEQKTAWENLRGAAFEFPAVGTAGRFGTSTTGSNERAAPSTASRLSVRFRGSAFELGQRRETARSDRPVSMRAAEAFYGPAGPFRYQSTVDALALTEEQKSQIQVIGAADSDAARALSDRENIDLEAKLQELNSSTRDKLDKVLTDEQRDKLKQLTSR